ncbi:hypothetical protein B0I37DRAFT_210788 [Chaetomium sp. MPI-CAGE-AT-0009]|nr:hypothetical protein B0I37DRAFT_210788 [Chaetomium sp. MPI-CAGE-AT-0009]
MLPALTIPNYRQCHSSHFDRYAAESGTMAQFCYFSYLHLMQPLEIEQFCFHPKDWEWLNYTRPQPTGRNRPNHPNTSVLKHSTPPRLTWYLIDIGASPTSLTLGQMQAAVICGLRMIKPRQWRPVSTLLCTVRLLLLLHFLPGRPQLACIRSPSSVPVFSLLQVTKQLRGFHPQRHLTAPCRIQVIIRPKHHQTAKSGERGKPKASAASILASIATLHIGIWFLQPLKLARALLALSAAKASSRSACKRKRWMRQATPSSELGGPADENTRLAQFGEIEAETLEVPGAQLWHLVGRMDTPIWPVHKRKPEPCSLGTGGAAPGDFHDPSRRI